MQLRDRLKSDFSIKEIDEFISDSECQDLIEISRRGPWHQSNFGSRKIFSLNTSHLPYFESLVKMHVPSSFHSWQYVGIHPGTFQIFRYDKDDEFPSHTDKEIAVSDTVCSLFTIVVYLNNSMGGQTIFSELGKAIEPQAGKAVIFPQNLLHSSTKVLSDEKFILRGQILYQMLGSIPY